MDHRLKCPAFASIRVDGKDKVLEWLDSKAKSNNFTDYRKQEFAPVEFWEIPPSELTALLDLFEIRAHYTGGDFIFRDSSLGCADTPFGHQLETIVTQVDHFRSDLGISLSDQEDFIMNRLVFSMGKTTKSSSPVLFLGLVADDDPVATRLLDDFEAIFNSLSIDDLLTFRRDGDSSFELSKTENTSSSDRAILNLKLPRSRWLHLEVEYTHVSKLRNDFLKILKSATLPVVQCNFYWKIDRDDFSVAATKWEDNVSR